MLGQQTRVTVQESWTVRILQYTHCMRCRLLSALWTSAKQDVCMWIGRASNHMKDTNISPPITFLADERARKVVGYLYSSPSTPQPGVSATCHSVCEAPRLSADATASDCGWRLFIVDWRPYRLFVPKDVLLHICRLERALAQVADCHSSRAFISNLG